MEKIAIADGGEGTCEAVHRSLGGELIETKVEGPLGSPCQAHYLFVGDGGATGPFAVIELAQADGITQSSCTYDAALDASTFGVGQLIVHALDRGATSLYIGLGGSASTDGGAGLLMAGKLAAGFVALRTWLQSIFHRRLSACGMSRYRY